MVEPLFDKNNHMKEIIERALRHKEARTESALEKIAVAQEPMLTWE